MKKNNHIHKDINSKYKYNNNKIINKLKKYNTSSDKYNSYIINNIIFNINTRKVSHFKDYLIFDDPNDFFRRFYYVKESLVHLKYYISFYEENNKIFPNYFCLPESIYIYRNIQQKQKVLNNIEQQNLKSKKRRQSYSIIFSSSIKKSIYHESELPSIISNGDGEIKKLIQAISQNYPNVSYINKKEIDLNDTSIKKLNKKELMENTEKLTIKNNLSSNNKISFISRKEEKIFDEKKKLEYENICMSDKNINLNDKEIKHKRIMTNYNNDLINICKNIKKAKENGKFNNNKLETKERIKKLIKTMKLLFKTENNKNKNISIKDIDNTNNNDNLKIYITSRNKDKTIKINSKVFKSVINSSNIIKKNDKKINQKEKLRKSNSKKIKVEKESFSNRIIPNKLSSKRKDCKINDRFLYHIKKKSNINSNILTEMSKINIRHNIISNNNSISFNSPFIRKKIENKLNPTVSYPKLKVSTKKKLKRKFLIKKCLNNKKKTINDFYLSKENINKYNNNMNESKGFVRDFSTQTNFRINNKQEIKNYKYIRKDFITPRTAEKIKNNKNEKIFSFLKNNNKIINNKKNLNYLKKTKYGLKSRNNTTVNSLNLNFSTIKHLKILNNLYTTINIYNISKNKNKSRNSFKTEKINSKYINETYCCDHNKLNKNMNIVNDYTYRNKKKLSNNSNNNNYNNNIIRKYINLTNSNRSTNTDLAISINKTTNNFNNLLINRNILHNDTYKYITKHKKLKRKNLRPSLIKKLNKEIIFPPNSSRISFWYKKELSKTKNEDLGSIINKDLYLNNINSDIRVNTTTRKLSTDDKKSRIINGYSVSEQNNKKNQQKIKLKNFKQLIDNLNSERKEIDRKKLHTMLNENNFSPNEMITGNI